MTKKKSKQSFGQLLREKRFAKGFSLRKFATLVDVSPTYISQVEQDNIDPPTADRVSVSIRTQIQICLDDIISHWHMKQGTGVFIEGCFNATRIN